MSDIERKTPRSERRRMRSEAEKNPHTRTISPFERWWLGTGLAVRLALGVMAAGAVGGTIWQGWELSRNTIQVDADQYPFASRLKNLNDQVNKTSLPQRLDAFKQTLPEITDISLNMLCNFSGCDPNELSKRMEFLPTTEFNRQGDEILTCIDDQLPKGTLGVTVSSEDRALVDIDSHLISPRDRTVLDVSVFYIAETIVHEAQHLDEVNKGSFNQTIEPVARGFSINFPTPEESKPGRICFEQNYTGSIEEGVVVSNTSFIFKRNGLREVSVQPPDYKKWSSGIDKIINTLKLDRYQIAQRLRASDLEGFLQMIGERRAPGRSSVAAMQAGDNYLQEALFSLN